MASNRVTEALLGLAACLAASTPAATADSPAAWKMQDAWGSEQLKLTGTFRARYENLAGQPRQNFRANDELISFRTTLFAQYDLGILRLGAELNDSRAYLAEVDSAISANEVNAVEIVQAYAAADLDKPMTGIDSLSVQAGRITMNLGSRRLVANDDYRNTANSLAGVRSTFKFTRGVSADFFYTQPVARLPDDIASLRSNRIRMDQQSSAAVLYGAFVTSPRWFANGNFELGYYGFRERDVPGRPTRDRDLATVDLRFIREPATHTWDLDVEAALQYGEARTGTAAAAPLRDVAASFLHLRLGYQWDAAWKPRLGFEYDWVSGEGTGSRSHRFDTLIGMRRADFAPSGLYNLIGRANLNSPGLRLELVPTKRLDAQLTYRGLWLASSTDAFSTIGIRDASGRSGSFAGQQIDARIRYWLIPSALRLEVDALHLFKGEFLRDAPNARRNGDAQFVSFNVQANF